MWNVVVCGPVWWGCLACVVGSDGDVGLVGRGGCGCWRERFGKVGVCLICMCDGDCTCGMCGKHLYTMILACERACVCGYYGWMM